MTDATIIVPTRHEADNAPVLAARASLCLAGSGLDAELLFVDDSDDHTPTVLADLAERYGPVGVLHRSAGERRGGLAGAVLAGIAATDSEVVAVMDGDLQHPPELLGALIAPVLGGDADIAIATRYAGGGAAGGLAGPGRRLVSRASRRAVGLVLPRLRSISDPLGGYFAMRRSVVDGAALQPDGFKILLEVLAGGSWERTVEVPYSFAPRHAGTSNASVETGWRFVRQLGRLAGA